MTPDPKYFTRSQIKWIQDDAPLKIMEKSRQVGVTHATNYRLVSIVSEPGARYDAFISTRDIAQARLTLENCMHWARYCHLGATDLGDIVFNAEKNISAFALEFANRRRIYALSSNPNALAGKCGHVVLDEFALHEDQQLLYRVAKPVTTWGGTLTIISTHRGTGTLFYQMIQSITKAGNPMGWSHHKTTIYQAVRQGLVERINKRSGKNESRLQFIRRLRRGCATREDWLQEYCCIPADESAAFITYAMITACEDQQIKLLSTLELLQHTVKNPQSTLYLGLDVARKENLAVIYVSEKIGDVMWDRLRLEFHNRPFSEIEYDLYRLLAFPQINRACIDATGIGAQLAERAKERFGWKVEPVTFTAPVKEDLAFGLRTTMEDRKLRIVPDDKLRADLRGLKKEVTTAGNIRFVGESEDSHCDRTWALALCLHAARRRQSAGGLIC